MNHSSCGSLRHSGTQILRYSGFSLRFARCLVLAAVAQVAVHFGISCRRWAKIHSTHRSNARISKLWIRMQLSCIIHHRCHHRILTRSCLPNTSVKMTQQILVLLQQAPQPRSDCLKHVLPQHSSQIPLTPLRSSVTSASSDGLPTMIDDPNPYWPRVESLIEEYDGEHNMQWSGERDCFARCATRTSAKIESEASSRPGHPVISFVHSELLMW